MLVSADWVVPVASAPIRNGAVLIHSGKVAEIGPAKDVVADPRVPRRNFPGCTIVPGLVNAHTHLAMTCLKGVLPPQPFEEWIARVPRAFRALNDDDIAASTTLGAYQCLLAGITCVGDIAYGPESISIAADVGIGGAFFWEVLGIGLDELAETLRRLEFPSDPARSCRGRFRCGISPHSCYTSGPELIAATHRIAVATGSGFAIHVAESNPEGELLTTGRGPLAPVAQRLAHDFVAPGSTTVAYLDRLGALEEAVAVHCTKVKPGDAAKLARRAAGAVLCPRSNAYLENGSPPAWRLRESGVRLALGTDSLASNRDHDLLSEARALAEIEPRFTAEDLIRMITVDAAEILGMSGRFGALQPGYHGDLAIYRVAGEDPYEALLAAAGRHTLEAVLSAGIWRVIESGPTFSVSAVERAAYAAGRKAAVAAAGDDRFG